MTFEKAKEDLDEMNRVLNELFGDVDTKGPSPRVTVCPECGWPVANIVNRGCGSPHGAGYPR